MSSSSYDNLIALKVLYMLVTPFTKTEAYKLGVIDSEGVLLIKSKDQTQEQKNSYDYLDRMVFNLKRLIGKLPAGKSLLASFVAALYLIKEESGSSLTLPQLKEQFYDIASLIEQGDIELVEETAMIEDFIELIEDGALGVAGSGIANITGSAVSTDIPVIKVDSRGKRYGAFKVEPNVLRRFTKDSKTKSLTRLSECFDINDPIQSELYCFAKRNQDGVLVLNSGSNLVGLSFDNGSINTQILF